MKANIYHTRITIGGNRINYAGDVGTPIAHLETAKLLFNSVLSWPNAKFIMLDLANFYLLTLMNDYKYIQIKLNTIPQEIIDEYNLLLLVHNS